MSARFTAACVQMTATRDPAENVAAASALIRAAHRDGARLVLTPENTGMIEPVKAQLLAKAQGEADHQALAAFRALARELGIWLLIGSLQIRLDGARCANRSFLIDDGGGIVARYDKIHMFDVDLKGGESYRESSTFRPGERAVVAATPWGRLGMSVCYDLRFPYLYRALAQAGAGLLSVPSAFTRPTGEAHWHVLLRARAIETGCFVLAPAQCGTHAEGRRTYGHSLIVSPWGAVLADGGEAPGVVLAEIDPAAVDEARGMVPALRHDRAFVSPEVPATGFPADLRPAGE